MSNAELFERGNYTAVALRRQPEDWRTYASLALLGLGGQALEGLQRFDQPEARFYEGVAHWIDGNDDAAARALEPLSAPHAYNLLALIRKPRIQVLAQWPWLANQPQHLKAGLDSEPRFKVTHLDDNPDSASSPYTPAHLHVDPESPPDFFICTMIEWHNIPTGLHMLPCPTFGHTADFDMHIQAIHPWMREFDELLVTDGTEWSDLTRLTDVPVSTFPKVFGLSDNFPEVRTGDRPVEFFVSGTLLHPFHPEKAALASRLLDLTELKMMLYEGFLARANYLEWLNSSLLSITCIRHPGAMPTRGLEALAMGCAVLVQEESALFLYADETRGVFPYKEDLSTLPETIGDILANRQTCQDAALRGSAFTRREFSMARVASQYLRFLTVLAARPRPARRPARTSPDQLRPVLKTGWLPGSRASRARALEHNIDRWGRQIPTSHHPRQLILILRETLLMHAERSQNGISRFADEEMLERVLKLCRDAIKTYPRSLVLRFNVIRASLHFGTPEVVSSALELLVETLQAPAHLWEIHPMDDILPYDFAARHFNYRKYLDLIVRRHLGEDVPDSALAALILASLYYYLAHYTNDVGHLEAADYLDPGFGSYAYRYAVRLLQMERFEASRTILLRLAHDSFVMPQACDILSSLDSEAKDWIRRRGMLWGPTVELEPEYRFSVRPASNTGVLQLRIHLPHQGDGRQ